MGNPDWFKKNINLDDLSQFKLIAELDGFKIYQNNNAEEFPIEITSMKDQSFSGVIELDSDLTVKIPIAFDPGWRVLVNGKEADISNEDGFIGVFLETGYNKLEFVFVPEGFKIGCILSVIGLMLFIFVIYRNEKAYK